MAVTRAQVSGIEALATWLNANATDFFSSVTYTNGGLHAFDTDGNEVFSASSSVFTAYRTSGANGISATGITSGLFGTTNIIMCDNGIILDTTYTRNVTRGFGVLIAKTNNDKLAAIFSYGDTVSTTENYLYKQIQHVALGDNTTSATTTTITPEAANQTVLVPFATNADLTDVSYCPNAFYMPTGQYYSMGLGRFELAESTYITNGYWAIKE